MIVADGATSPIACAGRGADGLPNRAYVIFSAMPKGPGPPAEITRIAHTPGFVGPSTRSPLNDAHPHQPYRVQTIGRSVRGVAIHAYVSTWRGRSAPLVVFGGFHGDEPKGVDAAHRLIEALADAFTTREPHGQGAAWVVVPVVNPDGYEDRRRKNANGIDINRNFPTENWQRATRRNSRMYGGVAPASEPETRAVIEVIDRFKPRGVVTIHSISKGRQCNNFDGPGESLARILARANRYPVTPSIGYPTPGSFGTWCGAERNIPTVTLEFPSLHSAKRCWDDNSAGLLAAVGDGLA